MYFIVPKLFDGEDQANGGGVIVACGAYASGAVSPEEVLVAGGFVVHAMFGVGLIAEVCGWRTP